LQKALLDPIECRDALAEIEVRRDTARRLEGKGGLGPRYSVISGNIIAESMPIIGEVWQRAHAAVEEFAGMRLEPFSDPMRRARVQMYDGIDDGFRWHFDGHPFVSVVTLENANGGVTELVPPLVSALVRPLFYPAYALPQIFSILPRTTVEAGAGDALIFMGRRMLHRGRSRGAGRRTVLVFAFDVRGARLPRWRNWIARWANY
jgi:hypothetical protein